MMMILMANRRDEPAIRNLEPNLTKKNYKYSKGKKMTEFFYPFQIFMYFILFVIIFR